MMLPHLELTNGDLLSAKEPVIAHGCNIRGAFGAGVAADIKRRWPAAASAYDYAVASGALALGDVVWVGVADNTKLLGHVITQSGYGRDGRRYVSYDALDKGLRAVIEKSISEFDARTVAIPAIGLGLGGGRWPIVSAILEDVGNDLNACFNIYVKDAAEHARYRELLGYASTEPLS